MAYSALFKLDSHDLHSEAEVETRLLAPLFKNLGYPPIRSFQRRTLSH